MMFADAYNNTGCAGASGCRDESDDLSELHRRVEEVLRNFNRDVTIGSQHSHLSTIAETPHAPPTYQQHVERALTSSIAAESKSQPNVSASGATGARHTSHSHPDLSYMHQYVNETIDFSADYPQPPVPPPQQQAHLQTQPQQQQLQEMPQQVAQPPPSYPSSHQVQQSAPRPSHLPDPLYQSPLSRQPLHSSSLSPLTEGSARTSDSGARSVSAGVSDESLAGDSGVFEASAGK